MKKTELFDKKVGDLLGRTDYAEWEFLKKYVFRRKDYSKGISARDLGNILMEALAFRGVKVVGIESYDENDSLHVYNWEDFQKYYTNDWLIPAVKEISKMKGSRSFIYLTIPRKVLEKYT